MGQVSKTEDSLKDAALGTLWSTGRYGSELCKKALP